MVVSVVIGPFLYALIWKDKVIATMVTKPSKDNGKHQALIVNVYGDAMSLQQKIHNVAVSILKVWHDDKDALKAVARINAIARCVTLFILKCLLLCGVGMMLPLAMV